MFGGVRVLIVLRSVKERPVWTFQLLSRYLDDVLLLFFRVTKFDEFLRLRPFITLAHQYQTFASIVFCFFGAVLTDEPNISALHDNLEMVLDVCDVQKDFISVLYWRFPIVRNASGSMIWEKFVNLLRVCLNVQDFWSPKCTTAKISAKERCVHCLDGVTKVFGQHRSEMSAVVRPPAVLGFIKVTVFECEIFDLFPCFGCMP